MDIQEELKQKAIELGLCEQWTNEWGTPDQDELCSMFVRGLDFCIKHDFPSVDYIKEHFDDDVLKKHGIFVTDGKSDWQRYIVALGDSKVKVVVADACEITALHNSIVNVYVYGRNLCYINAYGNCKVNIISKSPVSRICVSYWGGEISGREFIDKFNIKHN